MKNCNTVPTALNGDPSVQYVRSFVCHKIYTTTAKKIHTYACMLTRYVRHNRSKHSYICIHVDKVRWSICFIEIMILLQANGWT